MARLTFAAALANREIVMPEFSVTSRLPSIMNGGKDFCEWSRHDDELYREFHVPVSLLLKRDGVGLPECAVAESKLEKSEDVSGRVLDLMGNLNLIQRKGTPDIEFALYGLLARLRVDQGEADRAREHLITLRDRFQRPDCLRFLPNIDAPPSRVPSELVLISRRAGLGVLVNTKLAFSSGLICTTRTASSMRYPSGASSSRTSYAPGVSLLRSISPLMSVMNSCR